MPDTARPLTRSECEEAQATCDKATPGPWHHQPKDAREVLLKRRHWEIGSVPLLKGTGIAFGDDDTDASFIASSRTSLPRALATIRALAKVLEEMSASDGVEYDDERLDSLTVQIERVTWDHARTLLARYHGETGGAR